MRVRGGSSQPSEGRAEPMVMPRASSLSSAGQEDTWGLPAPELHCAWGRPLALLTASPSPAPREPRGPFPWASLPLSCLCLVPASDLPHFPKLPNPACPSIPTAGSGTQASGSVCGKPCLWGEPRSFSAMSRHVPFS